MFMLKFIAPVVAVWLLPFAVLSAAENSDVEILIGALKPGQTHERSHAAESLGRLGPLAAPAVPVLVAALADKNVEVQYEALLALEHIGPAARAAVPDLMALLKGKETRLHSGAIDA